MLFNSLTFLIFFPIVTVLYFVIPRKFRYLWLLAASYYFYMSWNPKYALLILTSTFTTYLCSLMVSKASTVSKKKLYVALSLLINLTILFTFKYLNFFTDTLNQLFNMSAPTFSLILPVGISFYTFQALGYTIDVYRGEVTAERNFFKYALFVSFFPQLVAGPIERSKNLLNQVRMMESVQFNYERMRSGLLLMIWGLFLKVVLAERAAIIVNQVYNNYENYTGFYVIIATFLFAIQIYVDFSAYSLIAIGAAEVLGFNLMQNFNTPYFSRTVGEFWRRWHISLSTWFRDYLYIPLGGNRCSRWRKHLNILIVFVVSGLWHGANWTFVIWGGLNGIYQIIGAELKPIKTRIVDTFKINTESFSHKFFQIVVVFSLINLSWIFFRAPSTSVAINMITHIFAEFNIWIFVDGSIYKLGLTALELKILVLSLTALLIASLCQYNGISIRAKLAEQAIWFRWAAYITAIMILLIFGYYGPTYSPSDFIYFQF